MDAVHARRRRGPPVKFPDRDFEIIESDRYSPGADGLLVSPITVKLTDDTHENLRRIAFHLGFTSVPAYVRALIADDIQAFFRGPNPAPIRQE